MIEQQPDLFAQKPKSDLRDYAFLVVILKGKDWMTAQEILAAMGLPGTDSQKRSIRDLASNSDGKIAGGQKGYKLVTEMTKEEFDHYRNWMKSQADQMTARIIKSDRVFFSRQAVATGNGIL